MESKAMERDTLNIVLMAGFALGMAILTGCGSSGSGGGMGTGGPVSPTGTLAAGGATSIYVIEGTESGAGAAVLAFSADASGSVEPTSTLTVPANMVAEVVGTDSVGEIFVGGYASDTLDAEILVYGAGAAGTATPVRTIAVNPDNNISVSAMTVDAAGEVYLAGYQTTGDSLGLIEIFATGANGTVAPTTTLTSTTLTGPIGIALDTTGKIYVSNIGDTSGQILVFAADANGSDAPVETISTAAATSTNATAFFGVAVDASGNIFAAEDSGVVNSSGDETAASGSIVEFAPGATGIATPTKTITGTTEGLVEWGGLRLDSVGNVYTVSQTVEGEAATYSVLGYGPNAIGSVTPGVTISSSALTDSYSSIAVY